VDEQGKYLAQSYGLSYLSSGRDLLRLGRGRPPRTAALLVGNPAFDEAAPGGSAAVAADRGRRSADLASVRFTPLGGTAQEVEAIGAILPDARVATGSEATEALVQKVDGPVVLHIASHGFFLAPRAGAAAATAHGLELDVSDAYRLRLRAPQSENPLIRSGLALAGANAHSSGGDDGILTALEVAGLRLDGTKLVVLSACETGVGEPKIGDGVYGLRRALVMAGSDAQVMSLWKVDDEATRDLMVGYYKDLRAGKGRADALREGQLRMLASPGRSHPYYWASFIQSGDFTPMKLDVVTDGAVPEKPEKRAAEQPEPALEGFGLFAQIGAGFLRMTDVPTPVPARRASGAWLSLGFPVLSALIDDHSELDYRDSADFDLFLGGETSAAADYVRSGDPEGKSSHALRAAYAGLIGYNAPWFGIYAGTRIRYAKYQIGDFVASGTSMPWLAMIELPWVKHTRLSLFGWAGSISGSAQARGVDVRVPLPFVWNRLWLTGGWEDYAADAEAVHGVVDPIPISPTRTSNLWFALRARLL